jgi:hypothetical protein
MDAFDPSRPACEWPIPPMDKRAGDKPSAFTWAMGELILQRIADGETMRAITAHPEMPAYCTVFRWMQMVPQFGDEVRQVRAQLAFLRLERRDAARRARKRRRRDGGAWHGGQRPRVSAEALGRVLWRVLNGASVTEALAEPGAPSAKAFYTRVRGCPGFRAAFADACAGRDIALRVAREEAIEAVFVTGVPAANAALRVIEARRGRLRPKLYRAPPRPVGRPAG